MKKEGAAERRRHRCAEPGSDVIVVFRPPYQTDAQTPGQLTAFSQFFGQHGYLPNLVDLADNINMRGTFIAAGPGIKDGFTVPNMRAIDVARRSRTSCACRSRRTPAARSGSTC